MVKMERKVTLEQLVYQVPQVVMVLMVNQVEMEKMVYHQ